VSSTGAIEDIRSSQEIQRQFYRSLLRRFTVFMIVVALIVGGSSLYNSFTVHQVRTSQITNTSRNDCELRALNGLLKDVPLAFVGDMNAADYSKVIKKC
jgi:hypothetical protein